MVRRKDGVDEEYRDRYRKWAGQTYKGKHPSHLVKGEKNVFPHNQLIPGYCLLCPMTSLIPTDYRYKQHFRLCHIKHAVVVCGSCENNSPGLQMFTSEEPGDRLQL